MSVISKLPALNAALNGASALLLILGYIFIRRRQITRHKLCMMAAFITSILFLISYVTYHWQIGSKTFLGRGIVRPIYFGILISHTILAVAIVPLALVTLFRALKERFDKHAKIARWTLPLWLYVSITGVVVYLMLYKLYVV